MPWKPIVPLVIVVAAYGTHRACVRREASLSARAAGLHRLATLVQPSQAKAYADRHHDACFHRHYSGGWGGPSTPVFDEEAYANCMEDSARVEAGGTPVFTPRPTPARPLPTATPPPPPTSVPTALTDEPVAEAPTPAPAETAVEPPAMLLLGDVKVTNVRRDPQLGADVTFMAIGPSAALKPGLSCVYAVRCGAVLDTGEHTFHCLTPGDMRLNGSFELLRPEAAPPGSSCTLDVWLTEAGQPRSNTVSVQLF